jgi:hypothetical protein
VNRYVRLKVEVVCAGPSRHAACPDEAKAEGTLGFDSTLGGEATKVDDYAIEGLPNGWDNYNGLCPKCRAVRESR